MCGGGVGNIIKKALPVLGGIAGSALLPGVGTALGTDLGLAGTIGGAALGSGVGEAAAGGNLQQDLLSGVESGATAGLLGSSDIGNAVGLNGSIGQSLSDTLSNTFGLTPNTGTADLGIIAGEASPTTGNLSDTLTANGLTPNVNTADLGINSSNVSSPLYASPSGGTGTSAGIANDFSQGLGFQNQVPTTSNIVNQAVGQGAAGSTSGGGNGGILSWLKNNAGLLLPAAGVAQNVIGSQQQPKGLNQLERQAAQSNEAAQGLINSEASGVLPPGQNQNVQNQLNDAISGIKAKFASMGLTGSTMEQQAIQQAQSEATGQTAQLATQATQTGLNALGASDSIYEAIVQAVLGQNQGISKSLANLASAATGTKPTINVTV